MKKAIAAAASLLALVCTGGEVTPERAAHAAAAWIATGTGDAARRPSGAVRTFSAGGEAAYHLVGLAGGGFVALPADDGAPPILGFTASGELPDADDGSELWDVIAQSAGVGLAAGADGEDGGVERARFDVEAADVAVPRTVAAGGRLSAKRVGAAAGGAGGTGSGPSATAPAGLTWAKLDAVALDEDDGASYYYSTSHDNQDPSDLLEDVRVAPFGITHWAQKPQDVYSLCIREKGVPNESTPCGCVAVAMAQVMRYHQWPQAAVPQVERWCILDKNAKPVVTNKLTTIGGVYDWANMPTDPTSDTPYAQRYEISKLCYDCGVSMSMKYGASESVTATAMMFIPLTNIFGYASAHTMHLTRRQASVDLALLESTMLANFDAQLPVVISVDGHAIVGDGYGYSGGSLFYHQIMGMKAWQNWDWWCLAPSFGELTTIKAVVYNIMPQEKRELVTGRVLDKDGVPVEGATVTATVTCGGVATTETATTSAYGVYAIATPSADCTVSLSAAKDGKTSRAKRTATAASKTGDTLKNPALDILAGGNDPAAGASLSGNSWGNDLVLLAPGEEEPAPAPESDWLDERAETTELTGTWSEPVAYDATTGEASIADGNAFSLDNSSADGRHGVVVLTSKVCFRATANGEVDDGYQGGVRIGEGGVFQIYTVSGGEKAWIDVAAAGVTPSCETLYTIRTTIDYTQTPKTYSCAVLDGGAFVPLKNGSVSEFALADQAGEAVSQVDFLGSGRLKSLLGGYGCFAVGDVGGAERAVTLTSAQADWLNSLGEHDAVSDRLSMLSAARFDVAYLLNLNIMQYPFPSYKTYPGYIYPGYSFAVKDVQVDGDDLVVKVKLTRDNPVSSKVNGELRLLGASSPGGDFADAGVAGTTFDSSGEATVRIPKSGAAGFFRAVILAPRNPPIPQSQNQNPPITEYFYVLPDPNARDFQGGLTPWIEDDWRMRGFAEQSWFGDRYKKGKLRLLYSAGRKRWYNTATWRCGWLRAWRNVKTRGQRT